MTAVKKLSLARDLILPVDFATAGVAVIGMRGSGKTNTEARFAEALYDAGVPFVVVDPKGDWHGLRSSADGKTAGLPVPVFGGLHGDFPLEPSMGARIADLLVDENISAVLDVSGLSKTGGLPTFLTAFCNQLMHRHRLDPQVRTVILEEAHVYIPQMVTAKTSKLKEAASRLLLEGRAFGLGCWAATQRPARLHKDVLEEVGIAIIHRIGVSATNDKNTIRGWVKHYDVGVEIVDSLTALKPGEAWVLIPEDGIVKQVQIERRRTFDSAATPKVGAKARRPNTMAEIDAGAIAKALDDVIERAKVDDPAEMRKRIKALEQAVDAERKRGDHHEQEAIRLERAVADPVEVAVPFIPDWLPAMIANDVHTAEQIGQDLTAAAESLTNAARQLERMAVARRGQMDDVRAIAEESSTPRPAPTAKPTAARTTTPARPAESSTLSASDGLVPRFVEEETTPLGDSALKVLAILAQHPDHGLSQKRLGALAGMSPKKSTLRNTLSKLRKHGYVSDTMPDGTVLPTGNGIARAADLIERLPSGQALIDYWLDKIGRNGSPGRVLAALIDASPFAVDPMELAEKAGIDYPGTSTLRNAVAKLRNHGLVPKGPYRLDPDVADAMHLPGAV